jgi:UDP:flavonoid glycosyltransferase YjiC (YdhE family)
MSIVCLPNCSFLSETSRMLAVHRALRNQGNEAVLATHGGPYEFVIQEAEFEYDRLARISEPEDHLRYVQTATTPWHPVYRDSETLEKHVVNEIEYFQRQDAEAVVSGFTLSAALSARAVGIPLVVTHLGAFIPPVWERGELAFAETWDSQLTGWIPRNWLDRFGNWLAPRMRFQTRLFNSVAKRIGCDPVHSTADLMLGDLTLVTDVPEILGIPDEDMEAWRPGNSSWYRRSTRFQYAGAIFAKCFGSISEEIESFLGTKKPTVYVALASTQPQYIYKVCSTLLEMEIRALVATTTQPVCIPESPDLLIKDFLPSHLVMPLCDLVIIHGGQGSVQTAIAAGVPLIGIPLQPEQNTNLRLVERQGAGLCLSLRDLKRGKLRTAIEKLLRASSYRKSMARLQGWQASRDGEVEAARAICWLVKGQSPEQRLAPLN